MAGNGIATKPHVKITARRDNAAQITQLTIRLNPNFPLHSADALLVQLYHDGVELDQCLVRKQSLGRSEIFEVRDAEWQQFEVAGEDSNATSGQSTFASIDAEPASILAIFRLTRIQLKAGSVQKSMGSTHAISCRVRVAKSQSTGYTDDNQSRVESHVASLPLSAVIEDYKISDTSHGTGGQSQTTFYNAHEHAAAEHVTQSGAQEADEDAPIDFDDVMDTTGLNDVPAEKEAHKEEKEEGETTAEDIFDEATDRTPHNHSHATPADIARLDLATRPLFQDELQFKEEPTSSPSPNAVASLSLLSPSPSDRLTGEPDEPADNDDMEIDLDVNDAPEDTGDGQLTSATVPQDVPKHTGFDEAENHTELKMKDEIAETDSEREDGPVVPQVKRSTLEKQRAWRENNKASGAKARKALAARVKKNDQLLREAKKPLLWKGEAPKEGTVATNTAFSLRYEKIIKQQVKLYELLVLLRKSNFYAAARNVENRLCLWNDDRLDDYEHQISTAISTARAATIGSGQVPNAKNNRTDSDSNTGNDNSDANNDKHGSDDSSDKYKRSNHDGQDTEENLLTLDELLSGVMSTQSHRLGRESAAESTRVRPSKKARHA